MPSTSASARARDHAVLHVVVRRDAAHGGEGRLACAPDQLALGLVLGNADAVRARAHLDHLLEARLALGLGAVQLHHQRRARVHRIAGVRRALGGADREVVHHLDGARHDPLGDDPR